MSLDYALRLITGFTSVRSIAFDIEREDDPSRSNFSSSINWEREIIIVGLHDFLNCEKGIEENNFF